MQCNNELEIFTLVFHGCDCERAVMIYTKYIPNRQGVIVPNPAANLDRIGPRILSDKLRKVALGLILTISITNEAARLIENGVRKSQGNCHDHKKHRILVYAECVSP